MIWILSSLAAAATCNEPFSADQLSQLLSDAERAYASMDDTAFPALHTKIQDNLPCSSDPISRELSARLHREMGLGELFKNNKAHAEQAFAAARTLETYYVFPEDLVPSNHPARDAYDAIAIEGGSFSTLPSPEAASVRLDGEINLQRPVAWAALFQRIDSTGKVVQTEYLWADTPAPNYPTTKKKPTTEGGSISLGAHRLGVGGAVVSAGLMGAGLALWMVGSEDYSGDICDISLPTYNQDWCNQNPRYRVGIGRVLTITGAVGLGASGVWLGVGPGKIEVGGEF